MSDPILKVGICHHLNFGQHVGMAGPAYFGATHLVFTDSRWFYPYLIIDTRNGVHLDPELRDPEGVNHIRGMDPEQDGLIDGQDQFRTGDSQVRILKSPCPLETGDIHHQFLFRMGGSVMSFSTPAP